MPGTPESTGVMPVLTKASITSSGVGLLALDQRVDGHELVAKAVEDPRQRLGGRRRPAVQEHDRVLFPRANAVEDEPRDVLRVVRLVPVLGVDVPADGAVADLGERAQHALLLHPSAEWAAEPRLRIDADDLADRLLGLADVAAQETIREIVG